MNREIERKFLVADDGWKPHVIETLFLRDGLVATFGGGKVRVRVASRPVGPPCAWVALKGARHGITRSEYEYEVPVAEAEAMLAEFCGEGVLEKTRHLVPYDGHIWAVDVYGGMLAGVVHAEVELDEASRQVTPPPWIGPEVTGQPQHSKRVLVAASAAAREEARRQSAA